jgi:hypothetical protein
VLHNGATQSRPTREAQASVLSVTIRGLADVASEGVKKMRPQGVPTWGRYGVR